jgi:uncharacterized protein DUF2877
MMINAISISERVEKMINGNNIEGFIHSVFDHACNIQLSDKNLIGLISSKYGDNPYSISLDLGANQTMDSLSLQQGMKVVINRENIRSVVGAFHINLKNALSWDPSLVTVFQDKIAYSKQRDNLQIVLKVLFQKGNFQGLGPLIFEYEELVDYYNIQKKPVGIQGNHYSDFIAPRIKELVYGMLEEDKELISNILFRTVGFGPGLTPSVDDLLVGMMAAFYYLGQYCERDLKVISYLKEGLLNEITKQTTLVSQQMLLVATQGEFSSSIKKLCLTLMSSRNKEDLENSVVEAINLGSTSGTDTLVGVLMGAYIISNYK